MKRFLSFYTIAFFLLLLLMLLESRSGMVYAQNAPTPSPTYDPLAEPFLPDNPSDDELGHNWYWHNCMTCHGDVGQGLTDEFRTIWPEDHQNCWAHGCHGGRNDDEGFPIPTVVPALVHEGKLAQFPSLQAFEEFLKSTHPPQDPGGLDDEQYRAIARYVFSMNNRPLDKAIPMPTPTTTPASTPTPELAQAKDTSSQPTIIIYIGLGIVLIFVVIWSVRNRFPRP